MTAKYKNVFFAFFVLFTCGQSFAQQGWWTWMKGSYPAVASPTWGTQGVPALTNEPPGEYCSSTCWTDSKGDFWQFSGGNGWGYPTLWKYSPATNMWTWVKGANVLATTNGGVWGTQGVPNIANCPPALSIGAVSWVDANDNLWLFGGFGWGTTGTFRSKLAAVWKYDPLTNMWTWMNGPSLGNNPVGVYGTQGVPAAANYPPARYETNAAWTDNSGNLWLFGGQGPTGELNDLWKYNMATNQWTWMKGSNTAGSAGNYGTKGVASATNNPPARQVHSRWKDNNGNFWFFGGTHVSNTQAMNDMWKYDPTTNNWTWMSGSNLFDQMPALPVKCVPSTTNYPQARRENNSNWKDACGNLWMFSGDWVTGTQLNDLWCYKVQTNEWVLVGGNIAPAAGTKGVPAAANMPPKMIGYAAWTVNNEFWLFGGRDGGTGNELNTLWRYYPDTSCAQSTCSVANPNAGFTATNLSGCAPLTVTFTNTSTNATSWNWNFGDGNSSTAQNPLHTYTTAGTYTVSQIAHNGPNSDTLVQPNYITVFPSAVAAFTANTDTICLGQNATFTNGSTNASTYSWTFGDGSSSANQDPVHSYTATGSYTVTLIAHNANGCDDTISSAVTVLSSTVTASFTQSPGSCAPVTINFTNASSGATTYTWTFGNGSSSTSQSPSTTYTTAGTYSVMLISSTNSSCGVGTDTAYSIVTLGQSPALNVATQGSVSCNGGANGTASVTATGGSSPYSYLWAPSAATTATATGLSAGNYSCVVTDASGCSATQTVSISQPTAITTSITNTSASCNTNDGTATATAAGGSGNFTYLWNPSVASTAGATGLSGGNYSCTVTDANGCTQISSTTIAVANGPTITVSGSAIIQPGSSTTLNATGGISYSWSPATGLNNSSIANPTASPSVTTTYCVFVFDAGGCYDSSCVVVTIDVPCGEFYLPNAFSPNEDGENDFFKAYVNPACVTDFKLIIYNRWGEKVFETNEVNESWNGYFRGTASNSAVYAWYCRATLTNGLDIDRKGNVSLVR